MPTGPKPPTMRAPTMEEKFKQLLTDAWESISQQPVVRAAGAVGDTISEGMMGNMGKEDSPYAGPAEGQMVGAMPPNRKLFSLDTPEDIAAWQKHMSTGKVGPKVSKPVVRGNEKFVTDADGREYLVGVLIDGKWVSP